MIFGVYGVDSLEQARFFSSVQSELIVYQLDTTKDGGIDPVDVQTLSKWTNQQAIGVNIQGTDFIPEELLELSEQEGYSAWFVSGDNYPEFEQEYIPVVAEAHEIDDLQFGNFPVLASLAILEMYTGDIQESIYSVASQRPIYILAENPGELEEAYSYDLEGVSGVLLLAGPDLYVDNELFKLLEKLKLA